MEAIKDTVENVMQAWELKKKDLSKDDPQVLLKKILNKKELKHIKFYNFRKGILKINVDSSAWLFQLSLKKEDLLAKLSKNFPDIKDIRFWLGEVR